MENKSTTQAASQSEDPRIDSPEIRVVYPSEPVKAIDPLKPSDPLKPAEPVQETVRPTDAFYTVAPISTATQVSTQTTTAEACTCKISWTDAIKQNVMPFLLLALGIAAVGYYIGKNK